MAYFHSLSSFISMGGYGQYVWPAYALAFVILVGNLFVARRRLRQTLKNLR